MSLLTTWKLCLSFSEFEWRRVATKLIKIKLKDWALFASATVAAHRLSSRPNVPGSTNLGRKLAVLECQSDSSHLKSAGLQTDNSALKVTKITPKFLIRIDGCWTDVICSTTTSLKVSITLITNTKKWLLKSSVDSSPKLTSSTKT